MKNLTISLTIFVLSYLIGSFIAVSFDISTWTTHGRGLCAGLACGCVFVYLIGTSKQF